MKYYGDALFYFFGGMRKVRKVFCFYVRKRRDFSRRIFYNEQSLNSCWRYGDETGLRARVRAYALQTSIGGKSLDIPERKCGCSKTFYLLPP
jgi:hypothetical protein